MIFVSDDGSCMDEQRANDKLRHSSRLTLLQMEMLNFACINRILRFTLIALSIYSARAKTNDNRYLERGNEALHVHSTTPLYLTSNAYFSIWFPFWFRSMCESVQEFTEINIEHSFRQSSFKNHFFSSPHVSARCLHERSPRGERECYAN